MMKKAALVVLFIVFVVKVHSQSPGGVSANLRWWMKANVGTFTDNGVTAAADGNLVQQWNDQSTVANHARQLTNANKPTYRTNIINGNPVLRFNSDQFIDALAAPGIAGNESMQIFLVFKQNSFVPGGTTDGNGTFIIDRPTATDPLGSFKIVNTDKYFYQKRNDGGGSLSGPVTVTSAQVGPFSILSYYRHYNVEYGIFINGKFDVTSGGDGESITVPAFRIGRHATTTNGGLNGDFAEMIVYDTKPTPAERARITSYLAIKYGITMDQTTSSNYVNSAGTTIYPATTTHDLYDNNIAGIGRDNTTGLNQTSSKSQNAQAIVQISSPSSLDNGDYLIWGNDAPTIWNSPDVPIGYVNRISRIWRVAETGDVGTFNISFDLTGLGMDLTDATKFALLVDNNGVFTDATAHITGRSIVGNVVSFTGAGISNNQYFSLASSLIPGPGGVAATTVWLRADEEVYNGAGTAATNGQGVASWQTRGGVTAATATQATSGSRPTYVTNAANGNPVVRFNGSRFMDFGTLGISNTADLSMTAAFKPSSITGGAFSDLSGSYMLDRTTNTSAIASLKFLTTGKIGFQVRTDAGGVPSGVETTSDAVTNTTIIDFYRDYAVRYGIFYNGALENTLDEIGGVLTFPAQRLGMTQASAGGFNGDFMEYIMYNRDISLGERNRIDSYLAIKYGVSLDQVTLTNYTASDGVVVYPATTTHSSYVSDIAGIGRDNVSRLNQTSSKSINANAVLTVSNPNSLGELDFFIWGDNAGSMTSPNSVDVDGTTIKRRLSRVWRVAERGDVGTTTMVFDLTAVPGNKVNGDLRLMIDRNGNGFADNDVTPVNGTVGGQTFTVTNVNLQNNDYFTVGTINITTTPLPIQLLNFDVAAMPYGVNVEWSTVNEINNDYFLVQRSLDGEKFKDVHRVAGAGAGTWEGKLDYNIEDTPNALGDIYYRLKQVDIDGKTSFSPIRKVNLTESPFVVTVYPNPVDNGEFTLELPAYNHATSVQIMNSAGQVVYTGTTRDTVNKFNVSDLPKGMYIIRVMSNAGAATSKVVVR